MKKRIFAAVALCLMLIAVLSGCSSNKEQNIYEDISDLNGRKTSITTGCNFDASLQTYFPDSEVIYANSFADLIPALTSNKIDFFLCDEPWGQYCCSQNKDIAIYGGTLFSEDYGLVFSKSDEGTALCQEFNEFLSELPDKEQYLADLKECWCNVDSSVHPKLDMDALTGENGNLRVCVDSGDPPFEFWEDGMITGYNIELIYRFCESRGYSFTVYDATFDSLIPGVISGKYDIASSATTITEERQKSVNFSDPTYHGGPVAVVRVENMPIQTDSGNSQNFFAKTVESFKNTFITENRYEFFINGILISLLIAVASLVIGTLVGFGAYMWYRRGGKIFKKFTELFNWFISGIPEVLFLLILYYIVFRNSTVSGTVVSIIAFSVIVANVVFNMIKQSVEAVDNGQMEAALAIGYSKNRGFFRIIFPQALYYIMPSYKAEIITLIKSTAIVGYVAVQDLTKISDIIRSKTFEPFFPLIVTAILYFVMAWALIKLVEKFQVNLLPVRKNSNKMLKRLGIDKEGNRK